MDAAAAQRTAATQSEEREGGRARNLRNGMRSQAKKREEVVPVRRRKDSARKERPGEEAAGRRGRLLHARQGAGGKHWQGLSGRKKTARPVSSGRAVKGDYPFSALRKPSAERSMTASSTAKERRK